jgi:small GTP-binding protein
MGLFDRIGKRIGDLVDDLTAPDQVRSLFDQARAAWESADYGQAETLLEQVTRENGEHWRAWLLLGSCQLELGRFRDARSTFERALTIRPDDAQALTLLARAQQALGDQKAALENTKAALSSGADKELLTEIYAARGEIYLHARDADRAVRELRKALAASGGQDPGLSGLLGLALKLDKKPEIARSHLSRAAAAAPDSRVLAALIGVLIELDQADEALMAAKRLLELDPQNATSRALEAEALLALGRVSQARDALLRGLELDRSIGRLYSLLARACQKSGDYTAALEHILRALELNGDSKTELIAALEIGFELLPPPDAASSERSKYVDRMGDLGRRLLALAPHTPIGQAAAAIGKSDAPNESMQLAALSLKRGDSYAGQMALGWLFEQGKQYAAACVAFEDALRQRADSSSARKALLRNLSQRVAPAAEQPSGAPRSTFYALLSRAQSLVAARHDTSDLAPAIGQLTRELDAPLLVAVMGEFNTGKSTFVNALIGEQIAPMGITPTTATINLLKYGTERGARIIWQDDREELLAWSEVPSFLRGLDNHQARAVRLVELLYPAEELQRVNVVDTPGLNSIVDEHEQTAREFIQQADAVVWLFSADQAGKQTEERALETIRKQRLKTVGVVNKVDRLAPAQIEQVCEHLEEGFGELVDAIIPVSAKQALEALAKEDQDALAASRFGELRGFLEQRIFSRSRRIKRDASTRKLIDLGREALERLAREQRSQAAVRDRLQAARLALGELGASPVISQVGQARDLVSEAGQARDLARLTASTLLVSEQAAFEDDLLAVYHDAAREVLDFVRPRRWALGSHRVEPADRDFLLELLSERLVDVATRSRQRVEAELHARIAAVHEALGGGMQRYGKRGPELLAVLDEQLDLLRQQVYSRLLAFARGILLGGRVERFFRDELADLKLEQQPIVDALSIDMPALVSEFSASFASWLQAARERFDSWLTQHQGELSVAELELSAAAIDPLESLVNQASKALAEA